MTSDPGARAALERAMRQTVDQADALRRLLSDLRPPDLDEVGLPAALGTLVRRTARRSGVDIALGVDLTHDRVAAATRLHPDVEAAVYRIVQEALTNVARHAQAATARVAVREHGDRIEVEIADDGCGFDTGARADGFGLLGIRERVELLGGRLDVESGGDGTALRAEIPGRRAA